jgi:hypothetical protein
MVDDGRPNGAEVLPCLLNTAHARKLAAVAPAVLDIKAPEQFAFPYPRDSRYVFQRGEIGTDQFISGIAGEFAIAPLRFARALSHLRKAYKSALPELTNQEFWRGLYQLKKTSPDVH